MARFDIESLLCADVIESIGVNTMPRYAFDPPRSRTSDGIKSGERRLLFYL